MDKESHEENIFRTKYYVGRCCVRGCIKATRFKRYTKFCFPNDTERSKQWVEQCNNPVLKNKSIDFLNKKYKVCARHFKSSDFFNDDKYLLETYAVPTLLLNGEADEQENFDESISADLENDTSEAELNASDLLKFKTKTCRLCASDLTVNNLFNEDSSRFLIFSGLDEMLPEKINFNLPIKIAPDDNLPLGICPPCKLSLDNLHIFIGKVIEADKILQKRLEDITTVSQSEEIMDISTDVNVSEDPENEINESEELSPEVIELISDDELECAKKKPIILENIVICSPSIGNINSPVRINSSIKTGPIIKKTSTCSAQENSVCHLCDLKQFSSLFALEEHQKVHKKPFEICTFCTSCGDVSNVKARHKKNHKNCGGLKMEYHLITKFYKCEYCDCDFGFLNDLLLHKQVNHNKDKLFSCKVCVRKFPVFIQREEHFRMAHDAAYSRRINVGHMYTCSECSFSQFAFYKDLVDHARVCKNKIYKANNKPKMKLILSPTKIQRFKCKDCKLEFPSLIKLNVHMVVHRQS